VRRPDRRARALPERNGTIVAFDLTHAIELAERTGMIVMSSSDAAMVVPAGVDVPPTMAEFSEIERVDRPGGVVKVCTSATRWSPG
jgi:hypothetical protein